MGAHTGPHRVARGRGVRWDGAAVGSAKTSASHQGGGGRGPAAARASLAPRGCRDWVVLECPDCQLPQLGLAKGRVSLGCQNTSGFAALCSLAPGRAEEEKRRFAGEGEAQAAASARTRSHRSGCPRDGRVGSTAWHGRSSACLCSQRLLWPKPISKPGAAGSMQRPAHGLR